MDPNSYSYPGGAISGLKERLHGKIKGNPFLLVAVLLSLPLTLIAVQQTLTYLSRAQTANTVTLSFSPQTASIPPGETVKIMLNSGTKQIAFARVVFSFDKSKIKLNSDFTSSSSLSTTVQKSSMNEANTAGAATIVLAASPTDTKPSGSFEFASFTITGVSLSVGQTQLSFNTNDLQIVDAQGAALTPQVQNLSVNGGSGGTVPTNPPSGGTTPTNPPNPSQTLKYPSPTPPAVSNPSTACQDKTAPSCFFQWVREYIGIDNTKYADFDSNARVDLNDFESLRRAIYP